MCIYFLQKLFYSKFMFVFHPAWQLTRNAIYTPYNGKFWVVINLAKWSESATYIILRF